ncbi:MAG: hypothetical protein K0S63_435 [Gammaproteobacteria bacterium]|nr:hypothetical protein [Gammaproteobacteria bacterium]
MANNLPPFDEPRENYLQELQDETVAQFEHMQQLQREKKQKEFERQFGEKAAQQNEYISQYNKTTLAQERALLAKNVIKGDWEGDEAFFAKWESFAYFVCAVHTCQRDLIVDVPVNYSVV